MDKIEYKKFIDALEKFIAESEMELKKNVRVKTGALRSSIDGLLDKKKNKVMFAWKDYGMYANSWKNSNGGEAGWKTTFENKDIKELASDLEKALSKDVANNIIKNIK